MNRSTCLRHGVQTLMFVTSRPLPSTNIATSKIAHDWHMPSRTRRSMVQALFST
jgi:hypothetical protein